MNNWYITPSREQLLEQHAERLDSLNTLIHYQKEGKYDYDQRTAAIIDSLTAQFYDRGLTYRQWDFVADLVARVEDASPIEGDFAPILVMFQLAGEHLKRPKIRLISDDNEFVQLNFYPQTPDNKPSTTIKVFTGGWSGHGMRKFAGWIRDGHLIPYRKDSLTESMIAVIQFLASDPAQCSKAMAMRLSACMYCAQRLSDPESKARGYGPICAQHYRMPWGDATNNGPIVTETTDLMTLFN